MAHDWQIKHTKSVSTKRVRATLHLYRLRVESPDDLCNHGLERHHERLVSAALIERKVYRVILALFATDVVDAPRAWKKIAVFVKTHCHNSVSSIKGFFNSIAMVAVNVNIKHALVSFEQLYYSQNAIIYVAEAWSLKFLCVMETASPVNRNFTLVLL